MAKKISYVDLINCKTPKEVYSRVREWTTSLSDDNHLIRSSILEIHASVERELKRVLYQVMLPLVMLDGKDDEKRLSALENSIDRMSFSQVERLLAPCLSTFPSLVQFSLAEINKVRNLATHENIDTVVYKGRNPFKDHDAFAQFFFETWAFKGELNKFWEVMIDGPRYKAEVNAKHVYSCSEAASEKIKLPPVKVPQVGTSTDQKKDA